MGYIGRRKLCIGDTDGAEYNERKPKRLHRSRSTAQLMDLPWEILCNILSRLPIKSIGRVRFVSKTLYTSLIAENLFFITNALRPQYGFIFGGSINKKSDGIYLLERRTSGWKAKKIKIQIKPKSEFEEVYCTYNGLLCISGSGNNKISDITIHNPLTRESMTVHTSHAIYNNSTVHRIRLCFDPKINKHKVVIICHVENWEDFKWLVYLRCYIITIGETSWREIDLPIELDDVPDLEVHQEPTFFNGEFYWILKHNKLLYRILIMDISNETFRIMEFPFPPENFRCYNCYLVNFENYISLFVTDFLDDRRTFRNLRVQCWALVDAKEGIWSQQSKVGNDILYLALGFHDSVRVVGEAGDGNLLLMVIRRTSRFSRKHHRLFLYNPISGKQCSDYFCGDLGGNDIFADELGGGSYVFPFAPSLVSLKCEVLDHKKDMQKTKKS